jgi:hypothetical protein
VTFQDLEELHQESCPGHPSTLSHTIRAFGRRLRETLTAGTYRRTVDEMTRRCALVTTRPDELLL